MNDLDDICMWHLISRDEKKLNDMKEMIKSYKKIGCYKCDGFNYKCKFYQKIESPEDCYEGI